MIKSKGSFTKRLLGKRSSVKTLPALTLLYHSWSSKLIVGKCLNPGKRLPSKSHFPHLLDKTLGPCYDSYQVRFSEVSMINRYRS